MDFVEYYSVQISKKMKNKTNKYEPMTAKNITSRIQDIVKNLKYYQLK